MCFAHPRTAVSRHDTAFATPDGRITGAIGDRFVSRTPVIFSEQGDGIRIEGRVIVDGMPIDGTRQVDAEALAAGVTVELGRRTALLLHRAPVAPTSAPRFELVGESLAMGRLRESIVRAGRTAATVLIRGETGAGKELVARAVHTASARARGPYRAVNVTAVPAAVAASAFFGHVRGAFSGADSHQPGYFGESDGGSLFLDEIGDLPSALQPMLLRALESGEIQPVGARRARAVDVRIIAATDAPLDEAVADGRFSRALLHRLSGVEVRVPPLRERPDDIPRLLVFGLRRAFAELGTPDRLDRQSEQARPLLEAGVVAALCRYRWPGNVRELMNLARQIALASHERRSLEPSDVPALERILAGSAPTSKTSASATAASTPPAPAEGEGELDESAVLDALAAARWSIPGAARRLGIAKSTLYRFIDRTRLVRKAEDIDDDEIRAAWVASGGNQHAMSDRLRISPRSLTQRINAMTPPLTL